MKSNIGTSDKIIRIILAIIVAGLYGAGVISGTLAIVLLVVGAVFILTSAVGFCPIYKVIGISSIKKEVEN